MFMKKMLSALIVLLFITNGYAQNVFLTSGPDSFHLPANADVNSNYRTYANNVFGLLEASRVPTGLLLDYGFDFTESQTFNGVTCRMAP
jgi:hypothetical protein